MSDQDSRQVPISEAMRLASDHQQAGRLREAEAIYRAVLQSDPSHGGAVYNLALIDLQSGRPLQAAPVLRDALQRNLDNPAHWINYATAVAACGEPALARNVLLNARRHGIRGKAVDDLMAKLERMIQSPRPAVVETVAGPGAAQARSLNLTALLKLYEEGQYAQVEAQALQLWAQFPQSAPLARLLGSVLLAQHKYGEAAEFLSQASASIAGDVHIDYLLGLALRRLGRNEEARSAFERSLAIAPDNLAALLSASANAVTLHDAAEARRYAERAVALRPDSVDALRVLADAAVAGGSNEEAAALYRRGIALDPSAVDLYINLGDALTNLARADEATAEIGRALALQSGNANAHLSLGRALFQLGETPAAREQFHAAADLAPEMAEAQTAYLFCLLHDETVTAEQCFAEHRRIGESIEAPLRSLHRAHDNDRDGQRGLRIGFVSGDLRDHAVANLVEPIWTAMRGGRHKVFAYANIDAEDAVSARLRDLADEWVRVKRLDDTALAGRIRADRIDILFDLSGHTTGNRLAVFAMKPAPVQASWLGYPATTGLPAIDYRFVHGFDGEAGAVDALFTERLVRLQRRGIRPELSSPAVGRLPALATGQLTFGSFARPAKIGESTVALWSRVLRAVPGSRMLIASVDEARMRQRLLASFTAQGIAAERLQLQPRMPLASYLALHQQVDIVLDTMPFAGETTTHHALWMGVPVLTRLGRTLPQNQGGAILSMLGMSDWAADADDVFVQRAVAAAADLEGLDALRQGLRDRMRTAFVDSTDAVRLELDAALQTIWRRWCAGLEPEGFVAAP